MSATTGSYTGSFTVADIKRVFDRFTADYAMIGASTGLHGRPTVDSNIAQIKVFAEAQYLNDIDITLYDASGKELQAAQFRVSDSATSWTNQQPGNNFWPATPGGRLQITVNFNKKWDNLTSQQREDFRKANGINWGTNNSDLSHPTLVKSLDRRYVSNGYGIEKNLFKAL
jgi:hypothetical protein